MAQVKIFYEPDMELLMIFWQPPSKDQIASELGDGVILIKDETIGQPIGLELLSYRPNDHHLDAVNVELPPGWESSRDLNSSNRTIYQKVKPTPRPRHLNPNIGLQASPILVL